MDRRLLILGLALITGCARFQPRPISPAETAARMESRSLTNDVLKTFLEANLHREIADWPHPLWDFDMLTLAAFYYHPSLDVARAQWHVTQAGIKTAGGRPNPTLTVTPGYSVNPASGVSPWFPAVNFDVPIETAGKRGKRVSVAEHLSESAKLNVATTAWNIRSHLRASLIESAAAHRRMMLLQGQVSAQEGIVSLLEQQAEVGAIARSQLASSRVALQKMRLELADARNQLADTRVRTAEAIGVPVGAMDDVELSFDPLKDSVISADLTSADVRRAALQSRTDILSALAEYAAAESALQLEIARQYPDIHLGPGYQFDQGENKWSLGLSIDLPVFNRNQGPIAEAEARREEASARFDALQARVLAEIERAVGLFRASERNSATLQSLAETQANQLGAVEAQFKAGAADRIDLLNAQIESSAARLAVLDAQLKAQQALGALEEAVQRPADSFAAGLIRTPEELDRKEIKQ